MKIKNKTLLINITIIFLMILLQKDVSYYLQHNVVIFSVAIVCSFLYSIFIFFAGASNGLVYIAPIISLFLGYYIFWIESSYIKLNELIIGMIIGILLYVLEVVIFKRISL